VRVLLSADVDVDAMTREGFTPLMYGVEEGMAGAVALLLRAGADPSKTGRTMTPLQLACRKGLLGIAGLLLGAGADPTAPGVEGQTALRVAIVEGHVAIVRLLLTVTDVEQRGPDECATPLFAAVRWARAEVAHVLLEAGADVRRQSPTGWTLLHLAAVIGSVELTRVMLKAGIHPDELGSLGWTPVQCCAMTPAGRAGVVDCIRILVEAGADLSKRGRGGSTALGLACERRHIEVVTILLAAGSASSLPDDRGRTPLHLAAEHGHAEVVKELVAWGARLEAPDAAGRTPICVAMEFGKTEVVNILLDASPSGDALDRTVLQGPTLFVVKGSGNAGCLRIVLDPASFGGSLHRPDT
jgi:ankyrin repeat protein